MASRPSSPEQAGTTRVTSRLELGAGIEVELIDTAGIDPRQPPATIAAAAQALSQTPSENASLVLRCVDATAAASPLPIEETAGAELLVFTKCDCCRGPLPQSATVVFTSSQTRQGIEDLKGAIAAKLAEPP
jgi:tRNA U34 5-carboxymethylaminomethyl modifying GTPase MnmE/TrmE